MLSCNCENIINLESQHPNAPVLLDAFNMRDCVLWVVWLFSVVLKSDPDLIALECVQLFLAVSLAKDLDTYFGFRLEKHSPKQ